MVARIKCGKTIRGVLNYNEKKVREGTATCIDAVGFGMDAHELSFKNKLNRFQNLTERNSITKTNTVHISLNFAPVENLSEETLKEIANSYMEKIGFGDQPYLVYLHKDAAHPHIHIATVNIKANGERIELNNIGIERSEPARKAIEAAFGLIRAEDQKKQINGKLKPADLKKALYGKSETKTAISNIVRTVFSSYKYTSLREYNEILKQFNVVAITGEPGTKMFENSGLAYQLITKEGKRVGVPIKSSSIYDKPTLANIEKKFTANREKRKQYIPRLIRTIDKAINESATEQTFLVALKKEGINADFKRNPDGHIFGITYIDNITGCYFNGSDIGRQYSAKAILERLNEDNQTNARTTSKSNRLQQDEVRTSRAAQRERSEPRLRQAAEIATGTLQSLNDFIEQTSKDTHEILSDLTHAEDPNTYIPPELLRETRKKKRKRSR